MSHAEHPKIRLPRHLRTKLVVKVGEKVNLVIPFQVRPGPVHLKLSGPVHLICTRQLC